MAAAQLFGEGGGKEADHLNHRRPIPIIRPSPGMRWAVRIVPKWPDNTYITKSRKMGWLICIKCDIMCYF